MKRLLLMCCFLVGISTVGFAQSRTMRTPAEQADRLKTSLKLNDEQVAKVQVIYEGQAKSIDSLRKAMDGDMSGMREKFMPIMTATSAKIKAVLTPEQAIAFQKEQDEMAARRRQQ
jgi:Spy/CpxP family protein refolding chaperone